MRVELHKLLEAQPVLELFFSLWIAQAVEVLQNHDAQQHAHAAGGASAVAIGGGDVLLGGGEVHFACDGFQDWVGTATLLHSQIEKCRLVLAFELHESLITPPHRLFKNFCRDFFNLLLHCHGKPREKIRLNTS